MTWERIRDLITERYPMATAPSPGSVRLVLATTGDAPVRVGIRIESTTAYGEPVVILAADLGPEGALDPVVALWTNAILAHGALAVRDGVLELRAVLAPQAPASFLIALHRLAAEAAELKTRLGLPSATGANTKAFAHLTY